MPEFPGNGMKHTGAWKAFERRAAILFDGVRSAFSGSKPWISGTRSDIKHDRLYVECKWRQQHSLMTLWRATAEKARHEYKIPIICIAEKNKRGCLICFHSDDLERLARPDDRSDLPMWKDGDNDV